MNNKIEKVNKRNWSKINYGKTRQILFLLDKDTIYKESERLVAQNKKKQGRKFLYSNTIIELLIDLKNYFKMDYRKLQAFCMLFNKIIKIKTPDYTTICRRMHKLELYLKKTKPNKRPLFVAIDGSGLQTTNRGEWLRLIHKKGKIKMRNGFVKLVIAVDVDTADITGVSILDDSQFENKCLPGLLEQTINNKQQEVNGLLADGSYDTYDNFRMLKEMDIEPIINIRKNAITTEIQEKYICRRRKLQKQMIEPRTIVAKQQLKDKELWKKQNKYGRRWTVEYTFSVFKRIFGNNIYTKKKKYINNEIIAKINLYNKLKNSC
jgi:hypothetical protein